MVPLDVALLHNSFIAKLLLVKTDIILEDEQIFSNKEVVYLVFWLAVITLCRITPQ